MPPFEHSAHLPNSELIQRYTLCECIGAGGMGWVYRALDTHFENHEIALKIFYPHLVRDLDTTQFESEALITRRLTHPNIVQVYNYHRFSDEVSAMSMELITGDSLGKEYEQGKTLSHELLLLGIADIVSGLAFAHSSGILHRDIKPDNMLLTTSGIVKVADFGIAQLLADNEQAAAQRLVGTPQYMAPEQFNGTVLSPATDVYSFGALLYFLVHSHPPFTTSSVYELAELHCTGSLAYDSTQLRSAPGWLRELISTCLEKKPSNRFSSMVEVGEYLKQYIDIDLTDSSKSSLQALPNQSGRQRKVYQHVPEGYQHTARSISAILNTAALTSAAISLFSDEPGFLFATIFFTLLVVSNYCRSSFRQAISLFSLVLVAAVLPKLNPYSHTLLGGFLLDLEAVTGHDARILRTLYDIDLSLAEPDSLLQFSNRRNMSSLYRSHVSLDYTNARGETIFHHLNRYTPHYFASFVERGPDINKRDIKGRTALLNAIQNGRLNITKAMIEAGADVDMASHEGVSPLSLAVRSNHIGFLEALLSKGANPTRSMSAVDPTSVLEFAIAKQNPSQVGCLVAHGARVRIDEAGNNLTLELANTQSPSGVFHHRIISLVELATEAQFSKNHLAYVQEECVARKNLSANCRCQM